MGGIWSGAAGTIFVPDGQREGDVPIWGDSFFFFFPSGEILEAKSEEGGWQS